VGSKDEINDDLVAACNLIRQNLYSSIARGLGAVGFDSVGA
jgi:hypothetical protein